MSEDDRADSTRSTKSNGGETYSMSRRAVLLTIGQTALRFGVSSSVLAEEEFPQLPPGLYQPSRDHLGHALMSAGRFHPIPPDCPTDYTRPTTEPFRPLFFSPAEFAVVRRVAHLMLGEGPKNASNEDATPAQEVAQWVDLCVASGAGVREGIRHLDPLHRVLAVAFFGSAQMTQLETANPEEICRKGLEWLSNSAHLRGSDQFLSLTDEQQIAILDSISDERSDKQSDTAGTRFFAFLKREVVQGFYTSQTGLKELDFKGNGFYARSPGCNWKSIPIT